jgi:anti-sigma28 factor (negative regulator of flagellin synthesis)
MTMRIDNRPAELLRTTQVKGTDSARTEQAAKQSSSAPQQRGDQVQISDAGRALAAQIDGDRGVRGELSAERVAQIRQRIYEGAYNSVEVVEEVARRMIKSGDI